MFPNLAQILDALHALGAGDIADAEMSCDAQARTGWDLRSASVLLDTSRVQSAGLLPLYL